MRFGVGGLFGVKERHKIDKWPESRMSMRLTTDGWKDVP